MMIGEPIALTKIPNQRLFGTKAAARYLGLHEQTLRKLTAEGATPDVGVPLKSAVGPEGVPPSGS